MSQSTFVFDQQSANESTGGGGPATIQLFQPGQSFIPALPSVEFVRLYLIDHSVFTGGNNGLGATVYVNLRSDTITGPILASTIPVSMPDGFSGYPNFFFSSLVFLTPGVTYFIQPVVQSGDTWDVVRYNYSYSGGTAFFNGTADPFNDLWFREGVLVPEPSTISLFICDGCAFGWLVRRSHKKNQQPLP